MTDAPSPDLATYRLQVLDEYERLLDDQESSDLKLVAGGSAIHAHRHILACKSSVLARKIQENAGHDELLIDELDHQTLREMLRFLYAGKVDGVERHAKELLAAANRYEIGPLVAVCEEALGRNLSIDNAYEYLKLADLRNAVRLKEKAISFIVTHAKDMESDEVRAADLRKELLVDLLKAYSEAYTALTRNISMVLSPSRSGRDLDIVRGRPH